MPIDIVERKLTTGRVASQMVQDGDIGSVYGGTKISGNATVEEALVLAGLDFTVRLEPAKYNGKTVPDQFWVVREDTDEAFRTVGGRFRPIQNQQGFDFVDRLVGEDKAVIASAGALHGGRMVWFDLALGEFTVGFGDTVRKHLLVVNYHDGQAKLRMKPTPERLRCQNALDYSIAGRKIAFDIPHTVSGAARLERAHLVLQHADQDFMDLEHRFQRMLDVRVNPVETDDLIYKVLEVTPEDFASWQKGDCGRQPNWVGHHDKVRELVYSGPGSQGVSGTLWGVFNGLNSYYDHARTIRGEGGKPDVRLDSRMFGHSAEGKRRAFKVCDEHLQRCLN